METTISSANGTKQDVAIIDKSIEIFKGGSELLKTNSARAEKAILVGKDILNAWDAAYAIQDEEKRRIALAAIDDRSNKFLVNCGVAKKDMEESRKAITQLMDLIKSMFTESENKIDPKKGEVPGKVQTKRNQFAKEELAYQDRKRQEAEKRAKKAAEEAELRAGVKKAIAQRLISHLSEKKQKMTAAFNAITLEAFETKKENLQKMSCVFPINDRDVMLQNTTHGLPRLLHHSSAEEDAICREELDSFDFAIYYKQWNQEISELKQSLIDRLPSKKAELEEQKRLADEAERLRQDALKRAKEAEDERQAAIAAAKDEDDRKAKEKKAEQARIDEQKRLEKLQKDEDDRKAAALAAQVQREKEEADKIAADAAAAAKNAEEDAALAASAGKAAALFEETESTVGAGAPEARNSFNIAVKHAAGWVELFQFWFTREANKLTIEEMGKKSLNQIKAYAEKAALKGEKIDSKYLVYETETKAVNRKAKA